MKTDIVGCGCNNFLVSGERTWETAITFKEGSRRAHYPLIARVVCYDIINNDIPTLSQRKKRTNNI